MKLSVIICTHHPRVDYLSRTLAALRAQTLPVADWELLLVDNASQPPIDPAAFGPGIAWHPAARLLREEEVGLTMARLCGVAEARADCLLLVDDDNVLDPTYLEEALRISVEHSHLGAWGSARLLPEFEQPPAPALTPWLPLLALWDLPHDVWANIRDLNRSVPCGAGLCLRRHVALHWREASRRDPLRRGLDRKGNSLISMGDIDLALTACDLGLGTGVFTALRLTHLISARRVSPQYLLKLNQSVQLSERLLKHSRGLEIEGMRGWCKQVAKLFFLRGMDRRFQWRRVLGQAQARRLLRRQPGPPR